MSTLMNVKKYICEHNLDMALKIIETLEGEETQIGKVVKSRILVDKGEIVESSNIVNEILDHEMKNKVVRFGAIMSKIHILRKTGRYNEIQDYMTEGNNILESIPDRKSDFMLWFMGNYFNGIGNYYWDKGILSEALDSYVKAYRFRKELGTKIEIAGSLTNLGNIHYIRGEYDLALEKYNQTISIKKEVDNNIDLSAVLSNIGAVYLDKGELNLALSHFNQSLRYLSNSQDQSAKAFRYVNIGQIYIIKGELEKALDFLQKATQIYETIENKFLLARSLSFIGAVYLSQNQLNLAEQYLKQSLEYHKIFKNGFQISKTLSIIIQVKIEQDLKDEAFLYLKKLEHIKDQKQNNIVGLRYLLAKALLFKKENRLLQKYNAQKIFQDIIENPLLNETIKMEARLGFCELLIMEYELLMNSALPKEITLLIDQIYKYGQQEHAYTFITKGLMLKSRLTYAQNKIIEAFKLLHIAEFYCDEKNLSLCKTKIIQIKEGFNSKHIKQSYYISQKQNEIELSRNIEIMDYLEDLKKFKFSSE